MILKKCFGFYNGKELDIMSGLNSYDYGARQYNSVLPVWDRVDPLCETNYEISPYGYVKCNPINLIDLWGFTDYDPKSASENWPNFDPDNDQINLDDVVITAPNPNSEEKCPMFGYPKISFDWAINQDYDKITGNASTEYSCIDFCIMSRLPSLYQNLPKHYRTQLVYEIVKDINKNTPFKINTKVSELYKGVIPSNLERVAKISGKMAAGLTVFHEVVKSITNSSITTGSVVNVGCAFIGVACPAFGGGYFLLDMGLRSLTGAGIDDHVNAIMDEYMGTNDGVIVKW